MPDKVYITRLAKFMPNEAVTNDNMEKYLGMVGGVSSKARRVILRNNQIQTRYYALDENGNSTHSNTELTAEAIHRLMDDDFQINDLELLACGTTSPDQLLPSHTSMVHGEIGGGNIEIISPTGSCASGMHAMKYAYLAILAGEKKNAISAGSEKLSAWMHARNFEKESEKLHLLEESPILAFEKDFLRWMLSDGAGAALLQNKPNTKGLSLRIDWIETTSFANKLKTCMYAGCEKNGKGDIKGWKNFTEQELLERSVFSLRQDVKLLGDNIVKTGGQFQLEVFKKHNIDPGDIDYFLPHLSSEYFRYRIEEENKKIGINIPQEKWFTNLTRLGNVGAASAYFMLEELFHSGELKKGQKICVMVPESARFSYVFVWITVV